jgi:F0F1-type ATP synthase membrane subunit b/b'
VNYTAVAEYSQIASAVLFVLAMAWIWVKFIQPAVISAQNNANAQLAEAERHRDQAKAELESLQGETAAAQRDAAAIKQRVEAQAKAECEAIVAEAQRAGERSIQNAQGELDRSRVAARERLREELLDQALTLARSQAQQRVDERVNAELVSSFLSNLEHGGPLRHAQDYGG